MLENKYIGINVPIGKGETKFIIKSVIIQNWQREWEEELNARHYNNVQMNVTGKRFNSISLSRREEVVYPRLILGHAGLNATLQIVGKGNGLCIECQDREVEHVLFACEKYNDSRAIWQEMEGDNSIHDNLEGKGMTRERLRPFPIPLL